MRLKSKVPYAKNLTLLFSSLTFLFLGCFAFFHSFSLDTNTVFYIILNVIPASLIMGVLGYLTGRILEHSKIVQKYVDED